MAGTSLKNIVKSIFENIDKPISENIDGINVILITTGKTEM